MHTLHTTSVAVDPHTCHQVSVAILRPQISWYGPRFAICHTPPVPLALGTCVDLKVFYFSHDPAPNPSVRYVVDTTVRGPIFAIESITPDSVEFVIRNNGPGHPYAYLVVPRHNPRILAPLPLRIRLAVALLRPYVFCTYWRENNIRSGVAMSNTLGAEQCNASSPTSNTGHTSPLSSDTAVDTAGGNPVVSAFSDE